jgi:hypothetical protein
VQDYILEVRKLIPSHICKKIINYLDHGFEDAGVVRKGEAVLDKKIRNCATRSLLEPSTLGEKIITNFIYSRIRIALESYQKKYTIPLAQDISQLDLLKYVSNEYKAGYKYHVDYGKGTSQRHLSISICLNNDFEGGEFKFELPNKEVQYPQNEGDCIIFPSNFMFPHQVNQVTEGTRYALIAWVL